MGSAILNYVLNLWPFSGLRVDDLKLSDRLVKRLSLPEHTQPFVFAISEPENEAIVYILAAQNLSERSARDAEYLIKEVRPDAVVALVGHNTLSEIQEHEMVEGTGDLVPTSVFRVLMRCFMDKTNKDRYENLAGNLVLKEIFGIGFYGHFFVAKMLAQEIGSSFSVIESPIMKSAGAEIDSSSDTSLSSNKLQTLALRPSSLVPQDWGSLVGKFRRLHITSDIQSQMIKLVCPFLSQSFINLSPFGSPVDRESCIMEPRCNYCPPPFAQTVYPLLMDLHDIFSDIPSMGRALAYAQKMFLDVGTGEGVDADLLSEVYTFRIAVEGLRIALNNAGRLPIQKLGKSMPGKIEFHELSVEDKSHCLLAQTLRSQAKRFKTVVAVVDASSLAGLRKFWNTPIPGEVKDMVDELIVCQEVDAESTDDKKKRLLSGKPVVAVASGATAVLGVSSLSKAVPLSSIVKVFMFNVPSSLKIFLTQTHKATLFALTKILGPSKFVAPGFASSGAKASTAFKAAASAEKIRAVTHSVIASAEKTSLSAMRTAFYEIMRKRRVQPIGRKPLATFGLSVASCAGLLAYGDGIECAAESFPAAPSIASLGRGIQNLQQVSQSIGHSCGNNIQKAIESLMHRFQKLKIQ
ncbi:hypothetical protein SOVF_095870 [Spinacia oleracea]|uniref:Uncharacterized protein LOC110795707 n=1 Tax=Spinacia oleracea TaxID=3562 RepID=A0A9R0IXT3_SPIOL|nr:uncharacterized protein LOC110795707 [Spinacia oleracea]XP_056687342.1 uncharacterized protein LOC110795707 [Spinacia oleracea]KNA15578.1 hypothetical protein SOVF_095870 [Spinacia oleracea]